MIKLEFDEVEINRHRILCPNWKKIIDLISKTKITKVPSGLLFSTELFTDIKRKLEEIIEISPLNEPSMRKSSFKEIKIYER